MDSAAEPLPLDATPDYDVNDSAAPAAVFAQKLTLAGHVQGVGFRPFVFRLAERLGLHGYVQNRLGEVEIVAQGSRQALRRFAHELLHRAPPLSRPTIEALHDIAPRAFDDFRIMASDDGAAARVFVPADYFMCDDCRRELQDPHDRRYRYPFINCTQCGPRYTLIRELPYDRPNTSMASFPLCADCDREYRNPGDRRFHAEPVCCPSCGPRLRLEPAHEDTPTTAQGILRRVTGLLKRGQVVAVKGIGGYHLLCDARSEQAVQKLRDRKKRPAKPLAVMFPWLGHDGLEAVRQHARISDVEAKSISSAQRPIVLVRKRHDSDLAPNIAPGLREIGVFLPYSPLHQLLLDAFAGPLVATSGNVSGEPVLTDNDETETRLAAIADAFVHHDRAIVRPADDSVLRQIAGACRPLRIGRGIAPLELGLATKQERPVLAVGAHMKGTIVLSWNGRAVMSPHIGEMDSPRSMAVFEQVAADLQALYAVRAEVIVCDAHPGYHTHRWAQAQALPVETVWHHEAHASALVGEARGSGQWLVFAWDGVGLGKDNTLWGGEALLGRPGAWQRVCSMRPFRLPGGDRAGREPWRSAAAVHWECEQEWPHCPDRDGLARAAWQRGVNAPQTSAIGRLFDAAAAVITGRTQVSFEAEAPMLLESLCRRRRDPVPTSLYRKRGDVWRSDWAPLVAMMGDATRSMRERAELFHSSIAEMLLQQARTVRDEFSVDQIGLCGGVFQNRFLAEQVINQLEMQGFNVVMPTALPCNDAALSFGQAVEYAARKQPG